MKLKRTIALLLALTLVFGLLAGCGDKSESADNKKTDADASGTPTQSAYAYQASFLPLTTHTGEELGWVRSFCLIGSRIYYSANYMSGSEEIVDEVTGEPLVDTETGEVLTTEVYEDGVFFLELETGEVSLLESYEPQQLPEGTEGAAGIDSVSAGADGTLWVAEQVNTWYFDLPEDFDPETGNMYDYYMDGGTRRFMSQYSPEGEKLQSVELDISSLEYAYFDRIAVASTGEFVAYDYEKLYVFGADGALKTTLSDEENGYLGEFSVLDDKFVFINYDRQTEGRVVKELNLETGEIIPTDISLPTSVYYLYNGYGDYEYTYSISDAMFGVKADGTAEKLFSWLDSDVNSNNIEQINFLTDGRVIALERSFDGTGSGPNVVIMNQVDASTLPEKQQLTLGCMGLDYDLRNTIIQFNRASQDTRIVVRDYAEMITDDSDYTTAYNSALQKLNTEILSGSAPDILSTDGLPVDQYIAKGILTDLWPLIDNDSELSREDLMTHFFDVLSVDGKLYEVTDSFQIQTAVVKSEIAQGRTSWTLDELLEARDTLQPDASIFGAYDTCDTVLTNMVQFELAHFMDWESGTCSFDSGEFIDLLNFAKQFPLEVDTDNIDWETEESEYTRLKNGRQLMMENFLYSFDDVQMTAGVFENKASYIGYPTTSGSGSSFCASNCLAITASCKNVDAAWKLVRELLLEENQTSEYMYYFPTNAHAFETYKTQAMTPEYTTDPETGEQVEVSQGGIGYNDFMVELYSLKQADFDAFWSVYENCQSITSSNTEVMELITDHAAAFFAGQKTAEETAKLIQDSISLYMMEQG